MRPRRLTDAEALAVAQAYQAGASVKEICKARDLKPVTVYTAIRTHGVTRKPKGKGAA